MEKKLNFALIGAGNVATKYVAALNNIEDANLVGVIARNQEKLKLFADQYHISHYAINLKILLDRIPVDVVIITTPSGLHAQGAIEAAGYEKHVLCEKPLDITLDKIDTMTKTCREAGVKLGCMFQHRTAEHNRIICETIQTGKLGKIYIANAFLKNFRGQEYYDSGAWRGTWELDGGGPFIQQAAHTVDLMVWMMGRARRVVALTRTVAHKIEVEDMGHAIVQYDNDAQGVLEASTVVKPGYPNKIEIHAEKGSIIFNELEIETWDVEDVPRPEIKSSDASSGSQDPMAIGTQGHEMVIRDFIRAIREDRQPLVTPNSARMSVELILAIYKASKEGRPVNL